MIMFIWLITEYDYSISGSYCLIYTCSTTHSLYECVYYCCFGVHFWTSLLYIQYLLFSLPCQGYRKLCGTPCGPDWTVLMYAEDVATQANTETLPPALTQKNHLINHTVVVFLNTICTNVSGIHVALIVRLLCDIRDWMFVSGKGELPFILLDENGGCSRK